ncbi:MAG: DUF3617 domain-containing protein [Desulfobulbaceae bacterium]|jgi:hypothetical protein|nr:DUF3617 domain-containing protein [Desulfobulbaceae bacterium]
MCLQKWLFLVVLGGIAFATAPASAFKIKPGQWQETNGGGTHTICLTPERAQKWSEMYEAAFDIDDPWIAATCKGKMTEKRSNSYRYQVECLSPFDKKIKFEMTVKKISDGEFVSDEVMFIPTESDQGLIRERTRQRGKKISESETLLKTFSKRTRVPGKQFVSLTKTTSRFKKIDDNEFVIHTTVQDGDRKTGWAGRKITEAYKYLGPSCSDPDEESARREGPSSEMPPVKPEGR